LGSVEAEEWPGGRFFVSVIILTDIWIADFLSVFRARNFSR
jgi:hypothetical protein